MTQKKFNEMIKKLRIVDDNNKVDYNWIALIIYNYKAHCVKEAKAEGYKASARGYLEEMELIDSYLDD